MPRPMTRAVMILTCGLTAPNTCHDRDCDSSASSCRALGGEIDADHDGLRDAAEAALARRFAPVVVLHRDDPFRPASVAWLQSRLRTRLAEGMEIPRQARTGSSRPEDWVCYVHAYPSAAGVMLQYWFYYPYNDGPFVLDHDSDWERITVALDSGHRPLGAWTARHENKEPGVWRPWSEVRTHAGTHPVVLSALGTHATLFEATEGGWVDRGGHCHSLEACRHPTWKTWEGSGLRALPDRGAGTPSWQYEGFRWGSRSLIPGRSAPRSPGRQRGFCALGLAACCGLPTE